MNPSTCRVGMSLATRRPPCRGSCRASSRTAEEREVARSGGATATRRRFDGGSTGSTGRPRRVGGGATPRGARAARTGRSRRDAGRARRSGRTDRSARRRARTLGGNASFACGDYLLERRHGARRRSSFPSPRRGTRPRPRAGQTRTLSPRAVRARALEASPGRTRGVLFRDATTPYARASSL